MSEHLVQEIIKKQLEKSAGVLRNPLLGFSYFDLYDVLEKSSSFPVAQTYKSYLS